MKEINKSRGLDCVRCGVNCPLGCRLGLIGDLGQTDNSASTLDHLTASNPGSVINVGDLSYADGYQPRQAPASAIGSREPSTTCRNQKCLIGHAHFHDATAAMLMSLLLP